MNLQQSILTCNNLKSYICYCVENNKTYTNLINTIKNTFFINLETYCKNDVDFLYYSNKNIKDMPKFFIDSCDFILQKNPLKIITSFSFYSTNILDPIIDDWNNIKIYELWYGQDFVIFNHNNLWYYKTSNGQTIENIKLENLNVDYCYHFILIDKNFLFNNICKCKYNIIYKCSMIKYTETIKIESIKNVSIINEYKFDSYKDVLKELTYISNNNILHNKITLKGFILANNNSPNFNYVLQTDIFDSISKEISNWKNKYQLYLDFYKKNLLIEKLPFYTIYVNETIHYINTSIKTISNEILNIYNLSLIDPNIYNFLGENYTKVLNDIHNIYVTNKKKTNKIITVTINTVYYYIKDIMKTEELIMIYKERNKLLLIPNLLDILCLSCLETKIQSELL
jgi:hypothetical protein